MNAVAMTDHGNMYGAIPFYNACKKEDLNPIIGLEAYVAPKSRFDKQKLEGFEPCYHLTLLAQNRVGFHNLIKLSSLAYTEGFYYKPRIDHELLKEYNEGIICLSGCVSGELSRALLADGEPDHQIIHDLLSFYEKTFKERYFLEIQRGGLDIQAQAAEGTIDLARRYGLNLVATCDAHYVDRDDAKVQETLLCINTGKRLNDPNRMAMHTDQLYVKTPEEMLSDFHDLPEAVSISQEIADSCDLKLEFGVNHYPVAGFDDPTAHLVMDTLEGLRRIYGDDNKEALDRAKFELDVIKKLGFVDYFLVIKGIVQFCRDNGILCNARGSAAGSIVAYCLGISNVCPLANDLLFERFLDPHRPTPPDIDIDVDKYRRQEVIQYIREKYGDDRVSQIGTFGCMGVRGAIRNTGRILGLSVGFVDSVVELVPDEVQSEELTFDDVLAMPDMAKLVEEDGTVARLIERAKPLYGICRSAGTHAGGIVISDKPITEYVPLQTVAAKKGARTSITQWDMRDVEAVGLLKVDLLGLRNLTLISECVRLIRERHGIDIDIEAIDYSDFGVFANLASGDTTGVFQLEGQGMTDLLQRLDPNRMEDISACIALYRPGPIDGGVVDDYVECRHGRKEVVFRNEVEAEILGDTYGIMVYQEQIMLLLHKLAGFDLREAYSCLKGVGKKDASVIAKYRPMYFDGCERVGILSAAEAEDTWGKIETFARYGFNRSHSAAYAKVAYITAWLKTYYEVEYLTALLNSNIDNRNLAERDDIVKHICYCRRIGYTVMPPDVNTSKTFFGVVDDKTISFALSAVKGVSKHCGDTICLERETNGEFRSLQNFRGRVAKKDANKTVMENLVQAGAFDQFGKRWDLIDSCVRLSSSKKAVDPNQNFLFETMEEKALPWTYRDMCDREKAVIGFYSKHNPLDEYSDGLGGTVHIDALADYETGSYVEMGGLIGEVIYNYTKHKRDGAPNRYALVQLESFNDEIRLLIWPQVLERIDQLLVAGRAVRVYGTVARRPGFATAITVSDITSLKVKRSKGKTYYGLCNHPGDLSSYVIGTGDDTLIAICKGHQSVVAVNSSIAVHAMKENHKVRTV